MAKYIARSYYLYTCAGCGKKRKKYVGEMYVDKKGDLGWSHIIHYYCCSKKCYYFAWFKYMDNLSFACGWENPQLLNKPEEYVEF